MDLLATPYEYRDAQLVALLPLPDEKDHKYSRGLLEAVVGSADYPGAACLVARASERMGAGYTKVYTAPEAVDIVRATSASLVVSPLSFREKLKTVGQFSPQRPCAVVVGSGFNPKEEKMKSVVCDVLQQATAPVLVDGGGLACLTSKKARRLMRERFEQGLETIITPHAGEAARLAKPFGFDTSKAGHLSQQLALALGVTCLVKGPMSYASDGDQIVRISKGTPALAKAGTGDVLAGMIGALLAQEMGALESCVLGASLHGLAGRAAESCLTSICVVASDLPGFIPAAVTALIKSAVKPLS